MKIDEVRELENEILKRLNRAYMSPLDHGRLTLALLDVQRDVGALYAHDDPPEVNRELLVENLHRSWNAVEKLLEEM